MSRTSTITALLLALVLIIFVVADEAVAPLPLSLFAMSIFCFRLWIGFSLNILITLSSAFFFLAISEVVLSLADRFQASPQIKYYFNPLPYYDDSELIYWAKPDAETLASKSINGKKTYQTLLYRFDHLGRRSCELKSDGGKLKHLLLFGCSYLFGEGLVSEDTVACLVAKNQEHFDVKNYAKQGFGPGEALFVARRDSLFEKSLTTDGRAFYFFIGDHVQRTVGSLERMTGPANNRSILWAFDSNHVAVPVVVPQYYMTLTKVRIWSLLVDRLVKAISPWVSPSRDEAIKITVDVLRQIKSQYLKRYPSGQFTVIIWPRGKLETAEHESFLELLKGAGIEYLDIPYQPPPLTGTIHPLDGHPSVNENRYVAEQVTEFLDLDTRTEGVINGESGL